MFKPEALALVKRGRSNFAEIERYAADPNSFLGFLDSVGVERAGLINYVAPEVIGFPNEVNDWCAMYCSFAPERLIAFGSVHPLYVADAGAEVDRLARIAFADSRFIRRTKCSRRTHIAMALVHWPRSTNALRPIACP